jgi:AcrR family transcriptional regulator
MSLMEVEHEPIGRVQRKRLEARARILHAAETLMRAKGFDGVKIQEITDAADVGHGTFYTHFKTKMDVLTPIIEMKASRLTARVDQLTTKLKDPAEVVSVSLRHLLTAIAQDTLWTWFLRRSELPMVQLRKGCGASPARDIGNGIRAERFTAHDPQTLEPFLLGALTGIIRNETKGQMETDAIDDCARMFLMLLGLSAEEAQAISTKPLPSLAKPDQ